MKNWSVSIYVCCLNQVTYVCISYNVGNLWEVCSYDFDCLVD